MKTAEEMIELALPSVLEGLKKELAQAIDWKVRERATSIVAEHVSEWVVTQVLPEISARLVEEKENLISLGVKLGPQVVEQVSNSFVTVLKEKLEKSWDRSAIFKALFG